MKTIDFLSYLKEKNKDLNKSFCLYCKREKKGTKEVMIQFLETHQKENNKTYLRMLKCWGIFNICLSSYIKQTNNNARRK